MKYDGMDDILLDVSRGEETGDTKTNYLPVHFSQSLFILVTLHCKYMILTNIYATKPQLILIMLGLVKKGREGKAKQGYV